MTATQVETHIGGQFVGGRDQPGAGAAEELRSPRDGRAVGSLRKAVAADVTYCVDVAERAAAAWGDSSPHERAVLLQAAARLLRERTPDLAALITAEMGKPLADARTEVDKAADVLDYYSHAAYRPQGETYRTDTGDDVFVMREPLGVVALVTPWNFPLTLATRKVAAAVVSGNAAILKPAPGGILVAHGLARALADAGLPDGVLNVLYGDVSDIARPLFGDPRLAGVSFTGSGASAQAIRSELPVHVPLQAELGGKNALVVCADADVATAVRLILGSALPNNGQVCTSAGRVLADAGIAPQLLEALTAAIRDRDPGDSGILASPAATARVTGFLADHRAEAAKVVQPEWPPGLTPPTLVVDPEPGPWTEEEIFGPVITFEVFDGLEEAIALANAVSYGLTAGIVTNDLHVARTFWRRSTAGTVKVNAPLTGSPYHIPLEGFGRSGVGAGEGGTASLEFFTRKKTVFLRRN